MGKLSSIIASSGLRAAAALEQTVFILPELEPHRAHDLTLLILADGNRRSSSGGGYSGGARRVVSIAEHLARRDGVATLVVCILSPDNIAKRGNGFFFELYKEFIQLGVEIETRGALVAAGVRLELWGDLESLQERGGHASLLADAVEAVAGLTAGVAAPRLRLVLGIGYGRDTAEELDVDILLRTGMEEPGVLRLSGLRTCERIATCATATLWPDIEPAEIDEVIAGCERRRSTRVGRGQGVAAIVNLVEALATAEIGPPVGVTISTSAPPATLAVALDRLFAGPLQGCATIAVEHVWKEGYAPDRYGPWAGAAHVLRIVDDGSPRGLPAEEELRSVLAPGQQLPSLTLPDWLSLGHANVHACGTGAQALVEALGAARRFSAAHPPLLGRDRVVLGAAAVSGAPEAARDRVGTSEREELADRFAARTLEWAASIDLLLPGAAWRRAALNYALTAFFIHFRIPTEWDESGALWEERADLAAKYMILVAAGDEAIFDRVFEGETPEQRWCRLEASSRFLRGALQGEGARAELPRVQGAEFLAAIADQWQRLFDRYRGSCLPAAAESFRAGLECLYTASLAEHRAWAASDLLTGDEERFAAMPPCIAARARALAEAASANRSPAAASELRALLYLAETSGAIGAGLLFRTAALAAPASGASGVTSESIAVLDAAATVFDYHVRLSNDVSGFLESPAGDRDPKENACTILVPSEASGPARAAAIVQALATSRRLAAWLSEEASAHLDRVAAVWPSMGVIFRRGALVGRRVYEVGHYTTLPRDQMRGIFAEADERLG
jgi:undecaprenyl pyrophosphate synthase